MLKRIDNTWLGAAIGFIAPFISFFLIIKYVYPFEFQDSSLQNLWIYVIAPKVISLAALPNLGFFFLFIYTNKLKSARGVLGATIVLTVAVFILKLI